MDREKYRTEEYEAGELIRKIRAAEDLCDQIRRGLSKKPALIKRINSASFVYLFQAQHELLETVESVSGEQFDVKSNN